MTDQSKIIVRPMKDGEQKELVGIGRRAFRLMEALFVGAPKSAMVAEYDGKVVGSIFYKPIAVQDKKAVYIEQAFVDPDYSGRGIGQILYAQTFDFLWKQGYDVITALVKDDNVGSWKLFEANECKRVSYGQIISELGLSGFLGLYVTTPFLFAVGMDLYMANRADTVREKSSTAMGATAFFLANIFLLTPLWIRCFSKGFYELLWPLLAYLTVLLLFLGGRGLGNFLCGNAGKFRLNNGGSFLSLLLSFWGNTFPMNANWYPETYENTKEFRKKLAKPELLKWAIFVVVPFVSSLWAEHPYWSILSRLASFFLIFMMIPVYPFESFGGGRVYRYDKKIWLLTAMVSIITIICHFLV